MNIWTFSMFPGVGTANPCRYSKTALCYLIPTSPVTFWQSSTKSFIASISCHVKKKWPQCQKNKVKGFEAWVRFGHEWLKLHYLLKCFTNTVISPPVPICLMTNRDRRGDISLFYSIFISEKLQFTALICPTYGLFKSKSFCPSDFVYMLRFCWAHPLYVILAM